MLRMSGWFLAIGIVLTLSGCGDSKNNKPVAVKRQQTRPATPANPIAPQPQIQQDRSPFPSSQRQTSVVQRRPKADFQTPSGEPDVVEPTSTPSR